MPEDSASPEAQVGPDVVAVVPPGFQLLAGVGKAGEDRLVRELIVQAHVHAAVFVIATSFFGSVQREKAERRRWAPWAPWAIAARAGSLSASGLSITKL